MGIVSRNCQYCVLFDISRFLVAFFWQFEKHFLQPKKVSKSALIFYV